ncbi:hypothetical protein FSP39_000672 [Pinctada imbricata]|uniref:Calpain catalytic domain-containing protein n=1 Tax=Pinctada imbricata TaxID=66713 RepID=A0AA89CDN3_PINIB|nr:hypothetical protein FSP39_000672 [Pinctada imbricata]
MGCGTSVEFDSLGETDTRLYVKNIFGIYESFWDFRDATYAYIRESRPQCQDLEVWIDEKFPVIPDAFYLRPQDICQDIRLYCKDPSSTEITQSELDTGYLLAVLGRLVKDERYIKRILPEECYVFGDSLTYDGVVCVKFWRFGRWEKVYIDDRIPLANANGARILSYCHGRNELWMTFIEKAWIKFWGGISNIEYGTFHDGHLHLTGGVQDVIYFDKTKLKPGDIYYRMKRGLKQGAIVACAVSTKNDGVYGLTAGDTFVVLDAYQVITQKVLAKELHLLRINDPLGFTNWKGPWSKESNDWTTLSSSNDIRFQKDENDFIMAFRDFLAYMEYVSICSLTPVTIDDDVTSPQQKYCTHLFGEWVGDSAAGSIKILDNPKFIFTVTSKGGKKKEKESLGLSLVQRTRSRTGDRVAIAIRLFKTKQYSQGLLIEEVGETFENSAMQILRTVKVPPGKYIVIGNTQSNGIEKEFLIRIYTSNPVTDLRMLRSNEPLLLLKEDKPINLKDLGFRFDICQEIWGKWSKGFHGDCYLENDFERNPQIDIFVPESDIVLKQTVRFKVLKDWNAEDASLGFRLFRIGPDDEVPKPSYWLFHNWENSVRCRDGSIEGWEWDYLAPTFTLEPGRYCGILYNETRGGSDTAFCIMVMSAVPLEIT